MYIKKVDHHRSSISVLIKCEHRISRLNQNMYAKCLYLVSLSLLYKNKIPFIISSSFYQCYNSRMKSKLYPTLGIDVTSLPILF